MRGCGTAQALVERCTGEAGALVKRRAGGLGDSWGEKRPPRRRAEVNGTGEAHAGPGGTCVSVTVRVIVQVTVFVTIVCPRGVACNGISMLEVDRTEGTYELLRLLQ